MLRSMVFPKLEGAPYYSVGLTLYNILNKPYAFFIQWYE